MKYEADAQMPISPKMIHRSGYIGNTGGEDDGTARCFGFSISLNVVITGGDL
jgi:hypothetical protein